MYTWEEFWRQMNAIDAYTTEIEVLKHIAQALEIIDYYVGNAIIFMMVVLILGICVWLFKWLYKYLNIFF